jgi:hypothetical protein
MSLAYSEEAGGANHSRLVGLTYPSTAAAPGRALTYAYGAGGLLNDRLSRLEAISDSTGTLEAYTYLGLGAVVTRSHPQPGLNQSYVLPGGDPGDPYGGLDRFGRVALRCRAMT